jgi:hypothetical protein
VASSGFSDLKCLFFSIQSQKDLEKDILSGAKNILSVMAEEEVKTLSL